MEISKGYVVFFTVLFIILGFVIGKIIENPPTFKSVPNSEQDIIDDCQNLSLSRTSRCLMNNVRTFFKYNESVYGEGFGFDDIKESGGKCYQWSIFYQRLGDKLGFETYRIRTPAENELYHAMLLLSDGEDYCIIDQTKYWCVDLNE